MKITKEIYIEELVELMPESVRYLREKGIRCIACGEPIWGTLEQAAREKGFQEEELKVIIKELNDLLTKS